MAQPPRYDRTKDFAEDYGDNTDHVALNAELDGVSQSINKTRANLALLQRDDGALKNGIVTADSLNAGLLGEIVVAVSSDIDDKVQQATAAATDSVNASINSQNSANNSQGYAEQAIASAGTAQANAQASNTNKNAAAASQAAAALSEASALDSKNAATASEAASALSETNAGNSADAAAASAASILDAEANSAASAAAALASQGAAAGSASAAATSETNAGNSATAAAASAASVDAQGFATDYAEPTEPATKWAYMSWLDTSTTPPTLRRRNAGNAAWDGKPVVKAAPGAATGDVVTYEQVFGVGQTEQNMTASRIVGTTYTNLTGKPITVRVSGLATAGGNVLLGVVKDAVMQTSTHPSGNGFPVGVEFAVHPDETYRISAAAVGSITWKEVR